MPGRERRNRVFSHGELTQQVVPLLGKLPPGSDDYTSVAYVLAYYDIDARNNVRRMCEVYEQWQNGKGVADDEALESLCEGLCRLYRRREEPYIFHLIMSQKSDGAVAEVWDGSKTALFMDYPRHVLREVAGDPKRVERLAWTFVIGYPEEDAERENLVNILKRMSHNREKPVAKAARYCLKKFQDEMAEERHTKAKR